MPQLSAVLVSKQLHMIQENCWQQWLLNSVCWLKKPLFSAVDSLTHKTKLLDFELIWSSVEYIVLCSMRIKMTIFFYKIRSNLSKMDQICPKWIKLDWIGFFINFKRKSWDVDVMNMVSKLLLVPACACARTSLGAEIFVHSGAGHTACTGFWTTKKIPAPNIVFQAFERFIGT